MNLVVALPPAFSSQVTFAVLRVGNREVEIGCRHRLWESSRGGVGPGARQSRSPPESKSNAGKVSVGSGWRSR